MIRGLPYDAEIEYLESTGTQWIDTGIVFNPETDSIEATLAVTQAPTSVQRAVFGARLYSKTTNGYSYLGLMCQQNALTARIYPGYIALGDFTGSLQPLKYKFGIRGRYQGDFSFGGTTSTFQFPSTGLVPTNQLCLFAYGSDANRAFGNISDARIGIFRIFRNSTLVRDFIPVRVGTVGYMYDRVSKRLFGVSGTGAFVLGPDKSRPVMSLHRYGASRFGKIGAGARMLKQSYTARDYVQDGLIAMWDGIENAGWGTHDPNATVWKDLVGDIDFPTDNLQIGGNYVKLIGESVDSGKEPPVSNFIESVIAVETNGIIYIDNSTTRHRLWTTDNAIGHNYYFDRPAISYANSGNLFSVSMPFGGTVDINGKNSYINGKVASVETTSSPYGYNAHNTVGVGFFGFVGKVFSIRVYSRALTADEIAANYAIDEERFNLP